MTTRVTPGLTTGVVKDTDKASKLTTSSSASDEGKVVQLNASGEIPTGYYSAGGTNSPRFLAYANSEQNYGTTTTVKVDFNTEEHDSDSAYDASTSRFTVPVGKAGVYFFGLRLMVQSVGSNQIVEVQGYKNGTGGTRLCNFNLHNQLASTTNVTGQGTFVATLAEGDYVEIHASIPSTAGAGTSGLAHQFFYGFKLV